MGAQRVMYQIMGRYMDGSTVVGYHLQSSDSEKAGRYTRDQVIYLTGRGQITNCEAQVYFDRSKDWTSGKVLLRGVGMSLDSLPTQQANGTMTKTEGLGKIRKDATADSIMTQLMLVGIVVNEDNKKVGYMLRNTAGGLKPVSRDTVINLARDGKIGNARVQASNERVILRGVGIDLSALPCVHQDGSPA